MITLLVFLLALTVLIAIHEFGHFIVARLCGVKVTRFSIGFGKRLVSWRDKRGTEWAVSAIPLGGYVKMLDEEIDDVAEEDLPHCFSRQSVWRRIAIVLAGPLFNILLAIVAFWWMFMIGITTLVPIIGEVIPDSRSAQAGLQPGQEIVAIAGNSVENWQDVQLNFINNQGSATPIPVVVELKETTSQEEYFINLADWRITGNGSSVLKSLGLKPYIPVFEPVINKVVRNSPASRAGLQAGDEVIRIAGQPVDDWYDFVDIAQSHPEEIVTVEVLRDGKQHSLSLQPEIKQSPDGENVGYIGVSAKMMDMPDDLLRKQRYPIASAFTSALAETYQLTVVTFVVIGKLITGQVTVSSLSGPIGIAQSAGKSARLGFSYFLNFLALVSISLAVLNILPIPMLDGGHLFFYLIEAVFRRPVPKRVQALAMRLGLIFILVLMTVVITNDMARLLQ